MRPPLALSIDAIALTVVTLLGCSKPERESCPDGTIPIKRGEVSVQTSEPIDTPGPLRDLADAEEVELAVTEQCNGLLPKSGDCRTYLVVTASAEACADRTLELRFQFANSSDPDDPAASVTSELAEARYRLPLEGDTAWATWVGKGPVTIDRNDDGDFALHFTDLAVTPATGFSSDDAAGTFLLSGSISGDLKKR